MSVLRRLALALVLAAMAGGVGLRAGLPVVRAADPEYTMATVATYDVKPEDRTVAVTVEVAFKNTTPNPSGQFSVFEVIDLAIHDGATLLAARDGQGSLKVAAAKNASGVNVASVTPRSGVRYNQQATFTLTYAIPDAASSGVRIRPSVVIFPAWAFGTSGTVSVRVPATYEVSVDGDELTASRDGESWVMDSGAVADPAHWLALVTASRATSYATVSRSVALETGTVDLQVRAWQDDQAWGDRVADLVARALPLLEAEIGLAYPSVGSLVMVESLPGAAESLSEPVTSGTEIAVGFDEPDFTVVHQVAHVWLGENMVADRWIREGFASRAAGAVAERLEVQPPFDPAGRRGELAGDAFPLVSWGAGEATPQQDQYAYAAAWAAAAQVESLVGSDALRATWQRIAAGAGPYDPVTDEEPVPEGVPATPIGSRALLDQLEAVSDADVAPVFAELVFDEETAAQLEPRAAAREAFDALVNASAGWGAPDPVKLAMGGWRFDDAQSAIDEAEAWLSDRDALVTDVEAAGLKLPQRLRDAYTTAGGGADARSELDAERAVVEQYAATLAQAREEPSILTRIGLLGGPQPATLLAEANGLFADGDLSGAVTRIGDAERRLEGATLDGVVRIAAVVVLIGLAFALGLWLMRRRRAATGRDYTAAP